MPLGIVSDNDFAEELNRTHVRDNGIAERARIVDTPKIGDRGNAVPEGLRKIISEEALEGTPSKELARIFDVTPSTISAYKRGDTSLNPETGKSNKDLKSFTDSVRDRIVTRANKKILVAMNELSADKIREEDARGIAGVMKDLSAVIKNLEPQQEVERSSVQFVYFAPPMKSERDYEVIDVVDV